MSSSYICSVLLDRGKMIFWVVSLKESHFFFVNLGFVFICFVVTSMFCFVLILDRHVSHILVLKIREKEMDAILSQNKTFEHRSNYLCHYGVRLHERYAYFIVFLSKIGGGALFTQMCAKLKLYTNEKTPFDCTEYDKKQV